MPRITAIMTRSPKLPIKARENSQLNKYHTDIFEIEVISRRALQYEWLLNTTHAFHEHIIATLFLKNTIRVRENSQLNRYYPYSFLSRSPLVLRCLCGWSASLLFPCERDAIHQSGLSPSNANFQSLSLHQILVHTCAAFTRSQTFHIKPTSPFMTDIGQSSLAQDRKPRRHYIELPCWLLSRRLLWQHWSTLCLSARQHGRYETLLPLLIILIHLEAWSLKVMIGKSWNNITISM